MPVDYGVTFFVSYTNMSDFTGVVNTSVQKDEDLGVFFNPDHTNKVVPVLVALSAQVANNDLSVKIETELISNSTVRNTIYSNSTLKEVSFYIFWVDTTDLEQTVQFFFDVGYMSG